MLGTGMTTDCPRFRLGPSWRWLSAIRTSWSRFSADELVRRAVRHLRMSAAAANRPANAGRLDRVIAAARTLWDNAGLRESFTLMVLGDVPRGTMAERLHVRTDVIEAAELLFLDIRAARQASSWINAHVIRPEATAGRVELSTRYRAAYWGGPEVAEWILDTCQSVVGDSVKRIAEQERVLQLKLAAALEMPITTSRESLQLQRIHLEYQHNSARLDLEKEKFRSRAELEIRKLKLAEQREQRQRENQQGRTEDRTERRRRAIVKASSRQQAHDAERRRRTERAKQSPLAALKWRKGTERPIALDQSGLPNEVGAERQDAAA